MYEDVDLPAAGDGMCCMGAAVYGPERCTCWTEELDRERSEHVFAGPVQIRPTMCHDCAFRHDSPERTGDPRYSGDIERIAASDHTFFCHEGMAKVKAYHHDQSDVTVLPKGDAYRPHHSGETPLQADGRPAMMCCGYARARGLR